MIPVRSYIFRFRQIQRMTADARALDDSEDIKAIATLVMCDYRDNGIKHKTFYANLD